MKKQIRKFTDRPAVNYPDSKRSFCFFNIYSVKIESTGVL